MAKKPLEYYENLIADLKPKCKMCRADLAGTPLESYSHDGGYEVENFAEKQWLYIVCRKCDYQNSLVKMGIPLS